MKNTCQATFLFIAMLVLNSCGSGTEEKQGPETIADSVKTASTDSAKYKIYSLPAPLQIPTALKNISAKYSSELLSPSKDNAIKYPTSFKKALNIGVYGIDLGYATVYDQRQTAIYYLQAIQNLANDLNIIGPFESSVIKRYKDNENNSDSLTFIILSSFNQIHSYLKDNNKRDVGLLILSGSFVEGLYLSDGLSKKNKSKEFKKLIGQQKLFLENLIELLPQYSTQDEVKGLLKDFNELYEWYAQIELVYGKTDNPNKRTIEDVKATDEQLQKISEKIKAIRKTIVEA